MAAPAPAGDRLGPGQRRRAVGAGAGVDNALGAGPFGPAVTMQSAGTPPAVGPPTLIARAAPVRQRTRPTLTIELGAGAAQRPAADGLHGVPLGRRRGAGPRSPAPRPTCAPARDTIPYDGRTYRYIVTATNGAGLESPQSQLGVVHVGRPARRARRASVSTPASNKGASVRVYLGDSRGSELHAGSSGSPTTAASGTSPAGAPRTRPGGFDVTGLGTSPSTDCAVTASTVNSVAVSPACQQQLPALRRHADADRAATPPAAATTSPGRGTCPPTGGPSTRCSSTAPSTAPSAATRRRRRSTGGRAPTSCGSGPTRPPAGPTGRASSRRRCPRRTRRVFNVPQGPERDVDPNGVGSCTYSPGCPEINFDISDFPPDTSWTRRLLRATARAAVTSGSRLHTSTAAATATPGRASACSAAMSAP